MGKTKKCVNCETLNELGSTYCEKCGSSLYPVSNNNEIKEITCPYCGKKITNKVNNCPHCDNLIYQNKNLPTSNKKHNQNENKNRDSAIKFGIITIALIVILGIASAYILIVDDNNENSDNGDNGGVSDSSVDEGEKTIGFAEQKAFYEENKDKVTTGLAAAYIAQRLFEDETKSSYKSKGLKVYKIRIDNNTYSPLLVVKATENDNERLFLAYRIDIKGYVTVRDINDAYIGGYKQTYSIREKTILIDAISSEEIRTDGVQINSIYVDDL